MTIPHEHVRKDEYGDNNDVTTSPLLASDLNKMSETNSIDQNIRKMKEGTQPQETIILRGEEDAKENVNITYQNCKNQMDTCCDESGPIFLINTSSYKQSYIDLKNKGVKIRSIIDVTPKNIIHCKQIIEFVSKEIKHLGGLKGNFRIFDNKVYVATSVIEQYRPMPEIIVSNVKNIVEQNRFIFEFLWNKAIPIDQRISQIEQGILPAETYTIDDPADILRYTIDLVKHVKIGLSKCT